MPDSLDDGMTTSDADDPGNLSHPIGARMMTDRRRDQRLRRNRPIPEVLEDRQLLASLASISNLTVPALQGYTLPLDGSGTTDAQTFTITRTSGSADITANIVSGPFWTLNVQYTDPTNSQNSFNGALTFQLFNSAGSTTLTPNTVSMFRQFTSDNYYTTKGKYITRVTPGFPGNNDIIQGGAPNPNGTGNSGEPGTPFANEPVQQLAFTGTYQLAMANAGFNTNDTQFFLTETGSPNSVLGYNYTIFGQMLPNPNPTPGNPPSNLTTLDQLNHIPVTANPGLGNEKSLPVNSPIFTAATMSDSNPSGVALIDTTQARPGDTATFQVTATDPSTHTTITRSFTVTAGAYAGPTDPPIPFAPLADPVSATVAEGGSTTITLAGHIGYPDPNFQYPGTVAYPQSLVSQPSHGTISNFDPSKGTFVYTPQPGYSGPDSFQYGAQDTYSSAHGAPATVSNSAPATVTITVTPTPVAPTITWANPADITYGTALGAAQLDATAPVPGTFTYSPAVGTVLKAGAGQLLAVTFSPTDTIHYTSATARVTINVGKATPTIAWGAPADITEGTALGAAQLDATASVSGTFAYSRAAGTVLGVGAGQWLTVTFTPADTADYASASAAVKINVNKAAPPPGTVTDIQNVMNQKQQVTQVSLTFGGGVDLSAAGNKANYRLVKQGKHGSFIASKAAMIKIKAVSFDPSTNTVILIPRKPFAKKKPVAVQFAGGAPSIL